MRVSTVGVDVASCIASMLVPLDVDTEEGEAFVDVGDPRLLFGRVKTYSCGRAVGRTSACLWLQRAERPDRLILFGRPSVVLPTPVAADTRNVIVD